MEQCKIKPWNIRKLHFAIDQLQGAGKRRDRKEMHRELDVMTRLLCESRKMTLPDYGQAGGAPISCSGLNMAVFTVKKGKFPQEIEMQENFFPCRLVEGERGDCLVCVVASAEIAKALAAKLELDSYIFMERAGVRAPEFSQYSKTTDDTGYYYLVQVNSSLPLQEPSAVFDAIAQIDALVDGLDEKTRKKLTPMFNLTRFELCMNHLGYAVKIQMSPEECCPSIAENLCNEVLCYDKDKYYSVEVLNEKEYFPINASVPKRLGSFMRAVYYWGAALRPVLDLK